MNDIQQTVKGEIIYIKQFLSLPIQQCRNETEKSFKVNTNEQNYQRFYNSKTNDETLKSIHKFHRHIYIVKL